LILLGNLSDSIWPGFDCFGLYRSNFFVISVKCFMAELPEKDRNEQREISRLAAIVQIEST
jgi:hypothetical protein